MEAAWDPWNQTSKSISLLNIRITKQTNPKAGQRDGTQSRGVRRHEQRYTSSGVREARRRGVLANPDDYDEKTVKQANLRKTLVKVNNKKKSKKE